jgi:hypothetical protein
LVKSRIGTFSGSGDVCHHYRFFISLKVLVKVCVKLMVNGESSATLTPNTISNSCTTTQSRIPPKSEPNLYSLVDTEARWWWDLGFNLGLKFRLTLNGDKINACSNEPKQAK